MHPDEKVFWLAASGCVLMLACIMAFIGWSAADLYFKFH